MGKRDSYEPGTFCWVDLATSNPEAAKKFYGELFGWEAQDNPAGSESIYSMMHLDGDVVCGLYGLNEEQRGRGVHPYWLSYVSVENAEAVTKKARKLGGTVIEEPFNIPDSGKSAVISDPEGAILPLWQPKDHIGAARVNDPGSFTWNELQTRTPESASSFYSDLFDWEAEPVRQEDAIAYVTLKNCGRSNGGMMPTSDGSTDTPANWLTYFTTNDIEASVRKVEESGGRIHTGPIEIMPGRRIAVVGDPQGAVLALFEGEVDD